MATTIIPDDTAGKVKRNAEIAGKSWSTYVVLAMGAGGGLAAIFAKDWLLQFIAAHPVLAPAAPFVGTVVFLLTRVAPQTIMLSGDKVVALQNLAVWLVDAMTAARAGTGPKGIAPPAELTTGLKSADVTSLAVAVNAAVNAQAPAAAPVDVAIEPTPASPPPMPRTAIVTGPKSGDLELADALLATVQQKYPGMGAAEAIAAVQSGLVLKARAAA